MSVGVKWVAAITKAHSEGIASGHLMLKGYYVWYPKELKRVRNAGRRTMAYRPIFPRYIFVSLLPGQEIHIINRTPGISEIVNVAGDIVFIPSSVMTTLIERCEEMRADSETKIENEKEGERLSLSEEVKIVSGPFEGLVGIIERIDKRGNCAIWLDKLKARANVPRSALSKTAVS